MSFKRVKVVMLPTKEKAPFGIGNRFITMPAYEIKGIIPLNTGIVERVSSLGHEWSREHCGIIQGLGIPQHLYFLSDEELVDGWAVDIYNSRVFRNYNLEKSDGDLHKMIASTDPSLGLPQPSEGFIKKFIEKWNKGEKIEEVDVEYDYYFEIPKNKECNTCLSFKHDHCREGCGTMSCKGYPHLNFKYWKPKNYYDLPETIKTNPKDNTITIKSPQTSWTKEEVIAFASKAFNLGIQKETFSEEWISKNL